MSDVIPAGGRVLSEPERAAFKQFELSPGNWAALVAALFHNRTGLRPPNLQQRSDALHLEGLRRELRTASGLSEQTAQFWKRLSAGAPENLSDAATRLLAWHLATDLPFGKREHVFRLVSAAAGAFVTGTQLEAGQTLLEDLRLLVDCYLPCSAFQPDSAPPWNHIPMPPAALLNALSGAIPVPALEWPPEPGEQAAAQFPGLVRLLGEPTGEWWEQPHPGRRAVERGAAAVSFTERERAYTELAREWHQATQHKEPAAALVDNIREWVDAVRKSVRASAKPEPPPPSRSRVLAALPPRTAPEPPKGSALVTLRSRTTGRELTLEDGMRVGRAEYRDVFGEAEAGLAAADQFELARDAANGAWLVKAVGAPRFPTWYQGGEVGPEGRAVAADGIVSVAGRLELVVRFG